MKIEEKFNKRTAELVEVFPPSLRYSSSFALGIKATFFASNTGDKRTISMHLTPDEALHLAEMLVRVARTAK